MGWPTHSLSRRSRRRSPKGLIDPDGLERAVRHALERAEGNKALKELEEGIWIKSQPVTEFGSGVTPENGAALFRAVFETTRSAVALMDLDGALKTVNPAFSRMFSQSMVADGKASYLALLDEGDRAASEKELEALSKGERTKFDAARRFTDPEGRTTWAHATIVLVRGPDGEPNQLVLVLENVREEDGA